MEYNTEQHASFWMRTWLGRGFVARLLWPLSLLFRGIVAFRRLAYRKGWFKSFQLPVPVIVVGNIFVGGTGKTPMVIWIVEKLRTAGFHPGVISRGYGTKNDQPVAVDAGAQSAMIGDEPLLIALKARCPLVVCRNRVQAGRFLLEKYPEVDIVICDDGLQHYALKRDIELILFDGRGAGNQWMLPAGPLREPATRHGHFTIINGRNYPSPGNPIYTSDMHLMRLTTRRAYQLMNRNNEQSLKSLTGNLVAAAGIGNPERFFSTLSAEGLSFEKMPLPDHYDYAVNPFAKIQADVILITEKDAVKCQQREQMMHDMRLWVVPADVEMDSTAFELRFVEMCHGLKNGRCSCVPNMQE